VARSFASASSQYLERTSAVVTAAPLTMSCWFNTATAASQMLMTLSSNNGSGFNEFDMSLSSALAVNAGTVDGVSTSQANSTTNGTSGAWNHACAVYAAANSRAAYVNGGSKGTETTSRTPSSLIRTGIGRRVGLNNTYMNGLIAEAAIWDVALTDAEVAVLAARACPLLVRPGNLVSYWPLIGRFSPEIDLVGGLDLTVTGATAGDHCRIVRSGWVARYPPLTIVTATAGLTLGRSTFSGTATFAKPTYTGSAALTARSPTFSGVVAFSKPMYTGSTVVTLGPTSFAGSATFVKPTYTGLASLSLPSTTFAGSATFVKPRYTGSAVLAVGGVVFTGLGQFTPVYAGSAQLTTGATLFAGTITFTQPSYSGVSTLVTSPMSAAATAIFSIPTVTGRVVAVSTGPASFSGVVAFENPVYTGTISVTVGAAGFNAVSTEYFPPSDPLLTVDPTSTQATVSGSTVGSTNTVQVLATGSTTWANAGPAIVGDGVVVFSPILAEGYYWCRVLSLTAGGQTVSNLVYFRVGAGYDTLAHSPADIISRLLITIGVGEEPPGTPNPGWPVYVSGEPTSPDNVITVYDTAGIYHGRTQVDGQTQLHRGIQVRVRSTTHDVGFNKAQEVAVAMAQDVYDEYVVIETSRYLVHCLSRISEVLPLGKEVPSGKRSLFTVNALASIKPMP
jgi:hypothetical protein